MNMKMVSSLDLINSHLIILHFSINRCLLFKAAWESPDVTVTKQEIVQQNVWRCPICTYDNEEYMSACDICGVLRNPLIKSSNNGQSSTGI